MQYLKCPTWKYFYGHAEKQLIIRVDTRQQLCALQHWIVEHWAFSSGIYQMTKSKWNNKYYYEL